MKIINVAVKKVRNDGWDITIAYNKVTHTSAIYFHKDLNHALVKLKDNVVDELIETLLSIRSEEGV